MKRVGQTLLACIALFVLAQFFVRQRDEPQAPGDLRAERETDTLAAAESFGSRDALAPARRDVEVVETSKIADVRVEPERPCAGDQFRVSTRLRDEDRYSKVFVDGSPGDVVVLDANEPGPQRVRILARGWDDTFEQHTLSVDVRECDDRDPRLNARVTATVVGEHEYRFELAPRVASVRWDFGDGATTDDSLPVHRFATRTDRPQSTYLVRATYDGPNGEETAYASVTHVEAAGIAARTRFPTLESDGARFVEWDAEDGLRTRRVVRNPFPEGTDFVVAELRAFPCDGSDAIAIQLPADQVLSSVHVDAESEQELELHVRGDTFDKDICQLLVRTAGMLGDRTVTDTYAFDTGVPDEREPIEPGVLAELEEVLLARGGGGGPVTAEELNHHRQREQATW